MLLIVLETYFTKIKSAEKSSSILIKNNTKAKQRRVTPLPPTKLSVYFVNFLVER